MTHSFWYEQSSSSVFGGRYATDSTQSLIQVVQRILQLFRFPMAGLFNFDNGGRVIFSSILPGLALGGKSWLTWLPRWTCTPTNASGTSGTLFTTMMLGKDFIMMCLVPMPIRWVKPLKQPGLLSMGPSVSVTPILCCQLLAKVATFKSKTHSYQTVR